MTENKNIAKQFDLLRTILSSNDDLQIQSSEEFIQFSIRLHSDVQIKCFIHSSASSLTISNLNDLHIYKISTNRFLTEEQWINIRDYFNQLVQQATPDTSLYSIIQSIQEKFVESINALNTTNSTITSTSRFREADLIFNLITYDRTIDRSKVLIGYEDRFSDIHEVSFDEFRKVHQDQCEIPIHSIQYYKIDEQIVWDRIKRYDGFIGSDINHLISKNYLLNLKQGMYEFNRSMNQWMICSNVPAEERVYLPEQCQFITWNILSSNHPLANLYSNERYREILKTLQSTLSDIICLQEVTQTFLELLFDENWLKENNYSIIIMNRIYHSDGQLLLMKNIQPVAFEIYSLDDSNRECIIARFRLKSNVMIDLINLHLNHSDEKRSTKLENLLKTMKARNYMIIGDVNFGDHDLIEESILDKSKYQIHDLWKEFYDLDENPGYTIDYVRNTCAQITNDFPSSLRADRYLLHKLSDLTYSITHLNMIGLETILINEKHLNQSNHYALQLKIHFQIRPLSYQSILAIVPNKEISSLCTQELRYIKLCCPFFESITTEDDEENVLLPLRLCLAQNQSFDLELNSSIDDPTSIMKWNEQSRKSIRQLIEQIQQLFPQCILNDDYPSIISNRPIRFTVQYIYILRQLSKDHAEQYHIAHQIPLGTVLEPIGLHQSEYISDDIREFFHRKNLYPNHKFFEQKQEKFNRLTHCFEGIFHQDAVHCFTYALFPYGSFRLGLHGDDLDIVLVLCQKNQSINNESELDRKFLKLKYDRIALNTYLIDLLQQHIFKDFDEDIINCRKIDALFPIISIIFADQIRVEIFVQLIFNTQDEGKKNLLANFYQSLHGVHDTERLITYVRFPIIFQHILTFIRVWAQNVGLYGQVYGYLGGFSWAILCACICRQYLPTYLEVFSLEQFFYLIRKFFSTYGTFNWSHDSIRLYQHRHSEDFRGAMQILCPSPPYDNSSRTTTNSTRTLIIQGFHQAYNEKENETILELFNEFPDSTIQSILQLTLSGRNINELNQWIGYMKSRLARFLIDCEENCQLFVQTDHRIESRENPLERFYFLGFQLNEHSISHNREFYYVLNRLLDQFRICTWRTETMKLSYKLMSIKQWQTEQLKC